MSERPILAFVPFALNTPHFETDLELLQEQCARGRAVHVLVCNAALPSCELNPTDSLTTCATCIVRRQEGLAALDRGSGRIALHSLLELTGADHAELGRSSRLKKVRRAREEP